MALVSMMLSKKERKDTLSESPVAGEREKYPWGLRITLETEALKKLGLDPQTIKVGTKMIVDARAEVTGASVDKTDSGDRKRLELQIVKMDVSQAP